MSSQDQVGFAGQSIFFEKIESSGGCQRILARAALALSGDGDEFPLQFSAIFGTLPWNEYQTLLARMSLRSSRVLSWSDDQIVSLRGWAA